MSDLISRAERFARVRHEGQFRRGKAKEPYTNHLVEVAALVERWSGSESAIAAAWRHDRSGRLSTHLSGRARFTVRQFRL